MKNWYTSNNIRIHRLTSGFFNVYLINVFDKYIMVDTARVYAYKKILKMIVHHFKDLKKLDFLFLTHTHFDHCENAHKIKELFNTKIIIGKSEYKSLQTGYTKLPRGTNRLTDFLSMTGHKLIKSHFSFDPVKADITINHIQNLPGIDNSVYVLPTPGHTEGSISLILNNEIAIVGDAMFGVRKNIYPPFANNAGTMIKSWEKLIETGCHTFLSGHGSEIPKNHVLNTIKKYCSEHSYK